MAGSGCSCWIPCGLGSPLSHYSYVPKEKPNQNTSSTQMLCPQLIDHPLQGNGEFILYLKYHLWMVFHTV